MVYTVYIGNLVYTKLTKFYIYIIVICYDFYNIYIYDMHIYLHQKQETPPCFLLKENNLSKVFLAIETCTTACYRV